MTRQEKILLFTLALAQFTHIMDFMIIMPLNPQLTSAFSIDQQHFGFLVSSYTLSAFVFGLSGAFFIDRFDRKHVLLVLYVGFTIGTFACAFANSYETMMLARIFTGAFGGALNALVLSIVGDAIPAERRAAGVGIVMTGFAVASALGVPSGLYLATHFNWHTPFLVLGALAAATVLLISIGIPNMKAHLTRLDGNSTADFLKHIPQDKNLLKALLMSALLIFGQFAIIPFLSAYMVKNVGFEQEELTYIYLCGGCVTFFTSPMIGRLADKYGRHKVFTIFGLLCIIPLLIITNLPKTDIFLVLLISTFFWIVIGGRMIPATAIVTSAVLPQNRGSFMSINSSVQNLSSGLSSLTAGLIVTTNAQGQLENYTYVGFIAVVFSLLSVYIGRQIKPAQIPATAPTSAKAA